MLLNADADEYRCWWLVQSDAAAVERGYRCCLQTDAAVGNAVNSLSEQRVNAYNGIGI